MRSLNDNNNWLFLYSALFQEMKYVKSDHNTGSNKWKQKQEQADTKHENKKTSRFRKKL